MKKYTLIIWILISFISGLIVAGLYMNIKVKSEQDYSAKLRDRIHELESQVQK